MAKGFTVKASKAVARRMHLKRILGIIKQLKIDENGKTIVFCLPGRGCSYTFLKNFLQLAFDLVQNGMSIQISQDYSSMVNFAL